jgi:hypothetical protein
MDHSRFELEKKVIVLGIVFGAFEIVASKASNRFQAVPESKCYEVRNVAFFTLKDVNADIPLDTAIVRNCFLIYKVTVSASFVSRNSSMPHANYHCSSFAVTTAKRSSWFPGSSQQQSSPHTKRRRNDRHNHKERFRYQMPFMAKHAPDMSNCQQTK